jgi:isoquinoline 1-oxidoreductase alpha subunit
MSISLNINGKDHEVDASPDTPLLWTIRDFVGLKGTKYGCGVGVCGACTVEVDGNAVRSCSVSTSDVEGAAITTIEGLSEDGSHPLQEAWIAEQVPQCGYCQPGMIMAAKVMLASNASPSEADIRSQITNVCRCGTYPRITRAIRSAAQAGADKG